MPTACLHESCELVEVRVGFMQPCVRLMKERFQSLESHRTGPPLGSICSSAGPRGLCGPHPQLHSFRHPRQLPPHVPQNVLCETPASAGLQLCRLWKVRQVHPVLDQVSKTVVPQHQGLSVSAAAEQRCGPVLSITGLKRSPALQAGVGRGFGPDTVRADAGRGGNSHVPGPPQHHAFILPGSLRETRVQIYALLAAGGASGQAFVLLLLFLFLLQRVGQAAGRVVGAAVTGIRNPETGEALLLGPLFAAPRDDERLGAGFTQGPGPACLLQVLQGSHPGLHLVPEALGGISKTQLHKKKQHKQA